MARRFEITYLTSGRDLVRLDSKSRSRSGPVVVAAPAFGKTTDPILQSTSPINAQRPSDLDRGGMVFRALAGTSLEALDLGKLLKLDASNVLLGEDATETSVKNLRGPRILHIATHGFFLSDQAIQSELRTRYAQDHSVSGEENPLLRSGLALSGANIRRSGLRDDGILTALEASQLDLDGTQLVVLSACDSGVGDVQNGDGVYGLRRALVLAGARTQITSLWKVADDATRTLMVDFYKRLINGEGRSEALRHAQQAMLLRPNQSHPYYWASFIAIGDWTPISPKYSSDNHYKQK
jgi:CHAT domain-containing protein